MTVRLLVLAVLATLALAAPASAARSVPHGFVGVHWSYELASAPADAQDAQWDVMASSGIESVRADFSWPVMQGGRGEPLDFTRSDALVRRATLRNVSLLPVVNEAPRWARAYKRRDKSPPRRNSDYASFIAGLVERYGPSGSFWTENPTLPKRPLREWQIWNEPHLRSYWDAPEKSRWGYPAGYGKLLRSAYRAVKVRDPGAKVVLAGITQRAWEEIEELYAVGRIKGAFDVAALQIFPQTVRRSVLATKLFRDALRARGDGRKPIYLDGDQLAGLEGTHAEGQVARPRDITQHGGEAGHRIRPAGEEPPGARPGARVLVHMGHPLRPRWERLQLLRAAGVPRRQVHRPAGARCAAAGRAHAPGL